MNKVLLQIWEESGRTDGVCQDGCSLHINEAERDFFIETVYKNRIIENLPDSYERVVGIPSMVEVNDILYDLVLRDKSIRLRSYQMNNLLNLEEIIITND